MATIKCKVCGRDLNIIEGESVAECTYCGARQTFSDTDKFNDSHVDAMTVRGHFALQDGNFQKAQEFFERALNQNPQNGAAYLGKVLVKLQITSIQQIYDQQSYNSQVDLESDNDYERAIRFSAPDISKQLYQIREKISYLRQGNLFLRDEQWQKADECFDKVLDIDPETAEAYLGKLLAARRATHKERLAI